MPAILFPLHGPNLGGAGRGVPAFQYGFHPATPGGAATFDDGVPETLAATDVGSGALAAQSLLVDGGAATDAVQGVLATAAATSDTLAASETPTGTLVGVGALSESGTLAEVATANAALGGGVTEALLAATESSSGTLTAAGALAEAISATDGTTGGLAVGATAAETLSTGEAVAGTLAASGAVPETLSASDVPAGSIVGTSATVETVAVADATLGAMASGTSASDSLGVAETLTGNALATGALVDAVTASDGATAAFAATSADAEILATIDAADATVSSASGTSYDVMATETLALVDDQSVALSPNPFPPIPPMRVGSLRERATSSRKRPAPEAPQKVDVRRGDSVEPAEHATAGLSAQGRRFERVVVESDARATWMTSPGCVERLAPRDDASAWVSYVAATGDAVTLNTVLDVRVALGEAVLDEGTAPWSPDTEAAIFAAYDLLLETA